MNGLIPSNEWDLVSIIFVPIIFFLLMVIAPRNKYAFYTILSSFLLKIIFILINSYYVRFLPWDSDWGIINETAQDLAYNTRGIVENLAQAKGRFFFSWLLSLQYRLIGESIIMILIINAALNTLTAILSYKIALLISGKKKLANIVVVIIAFFPIYIVYSADPSREPLVTFAFVISTYCYVAWIKYQKSQYLLGSITGMFVALSIHSAFAIIMFGFMLMVTILSGKEFIFGHGRKPIMFLVSLIGLAGVMGLVLVTGWGLNKIDGDIANLSNSNTLGRIGAVKDGDSRTGYMPRDQVVVNSLSDFVVQSPNRIFLFVAKPFPWDVRTIADVIGFMLVILHILFVYFFIKYRKSIMENKAMGHLAICALLLTFIFAFGTANWGTAARHKSKFFPIIVIICVVVAHERNRKTTLNNYLARIGFKDN